MNRILITLITMIFFSCRATDKSFVLKSSWYDQKGYREVLVLKNNSHFYLCEFSTQIDAKIVGEVVIKAEGIYSSANDTIILNPSSGEVSKSSYIIVKGKEGEALYHNWPVSDYDGVGEESNIKIRGMPMGKLDGKTSRELSRLVSN